MMLWAVPPVPAQQTVSGLSSVDLFDAADRALGAGRTDDALAIYDALAHDPDIEVRTEARFRKGMLLARMKRYTQAATAFREILDEKPGAVRVRLELARVLAAMGDEAAARRALRQAQASGLPPNVALIVEQFANALKSPKRLGGSIAIAVAPDSNINRATSARTLDTVVAPLTLSEDARERSGIGLRIDAQTYARLPLTTHLSAFPRASIAANLYGSSRFDDISATALAGLEWQKSGDRITPSVGFTWRWYGQQLYARTQTVNTDWIHALSRRAQLTVNASLSRARYLKNDLQDGAIYDLRAGVERALSSRAGLDVSVGATRQTARDPGYATTSLDLSAFGWREAGEATLFASAGIRRTLGDAPLQLFSDRRREWLLQASAGATFRQLRVHGFAPLVKISWERNFSTVGLYDYRRIAINFGINRAF
jgi:tetratricopeptide (TPR) repeat protein